jgi:hypothetical protein
MPGPKTIWVSDAAKRDLTALAAAWGLSASGTIARGLKEAQDRRWKNDACDCDESAAAEESDD